MKDQEMKGRNEGGGRVTVHGETDIYQARKREWTEEEEEGNGRGRKEE